MSATFTITLHLWWLWAYLAIGAALWLPLEWGAWRRINSRDPFWSSLVRATRRRWHVPFATIAAWPLAAWEVLR